MTVVAHELGRPLPAEDRGGDCRAFDLAIGRKVVGPHVFARPQDCQLRNGLLTVTVGSAGTPRLWLTGWRGAVTVSDVYEDIYTDIYGGSTSTPEAVEAGVVIVDSPAVSALLTGVRLLLVDDEEVIVELIAPTIANAYVRLRRGRTHVDIQHGDTRSPLTITRRISLAGPPTPVGVASGTRVEEAAGAIDGMPRFVAALDPVTPDAGAFSLTSPAASTVRFGAGVGALSGGDWPDDIHDQMGDESRPFIILTEEP